MKSSTSLTTRSPEVPMITDRPARTHPDPQSSVPAHKITTGTHLGITIQWAKRANAGQGPRRRRSPC